MNNCYYKIDKGSINRTNLNLDEIKLKIENYNKRDLYLFDNIMRFDISSLNIKKNCVICKLDNLKAIIFVDECYVYYELDQVKNLFRQFNNDNILHLNLLDCFFTIIIERLDNEFNLIFNEFSNIDPNNKYEINSNFIKLQSNLLNLEYRIKELHSITENLLENKEELSALTFNICDSNKTEELIQNYNLKIEDVYNDISKLVKEMDNAQKIANINLAKDRNKFALINLFLSLLSLSLSCGTFFGSIFGMNLKNYLENNNYAFFIITFSSLFFIIVSLYIQIKYLESKGIIFLTLS